ncbi:hypothetical protein Ancab_024166 [Ancistrocladus abbreviatus]
MAVITDHKDPIDPPNDPSKPKSQPAKPNFSATQRPNANPNPFTFWFYFTLAVSLITIFVVFLSSFAPQDPKTWFLNLPATLRTHYSKGRTIKVQIYPNQSPIEVFTYSQGPKNAENVLIVHGLGCSSFSFNKIIDHVASKGAFVVAIDLPGSGFSDKAVVEERERFGGVLGRFLDFYDEIKEKGLFWGFDNLIEHGYVPYEENARVQVLKRKILVSLELGSEEVGRVLAQVVDSLGLAPMHLVLHDSALLMGANWVSENAGSLRSITLIDTMPTGLALPLWAFRIPVVREVVLGFDFVFRKLIDVCCSKSISSSNLEAHRSLLRSINGRQVIVRMGLKLNYSFDLAEWANLDGVKGVPVQVLWSNSCSEEWSELGRQVAKAIPAAKFVSHSGGRWPQGDTPDEIAENIVSFVASLPKTERQAEDEPLPEHIHNSFDEADHDHDHGGDHHHDGHGHGHGHAHAHPHAQAGYMDAYGLGQGWGS